MIWLRQWYRRRRFIAAYRTLLNEYERHQDAGHAVRFQAAGTAGEAHMFFECTECPWYDGWTFRSSDATPPENAATIDRGSDES